MYMQLKQRKNWNTLLLMASFGINRDFMKRGSIVYVNGNEWSLGSKYWSLVHKGSGSKTAVLN